MNDLQLIELWETYLMHLDADEAEEQPTSRDQPVSNATTATPPSTSGNDSVKSPEASYSESSGQIANTSVVAPEGQVA